jgi:pyridoxamine 5'-phosphate oxidase
VPRRPDIPPLRRTDLSDDPIEQFRDWYQHAVLEVPLADAMALATVDDDGAPDARMVLLKGFGPDGFRFFTNLTSTKANQLDANGRAALVFYWREVDRQVRVRGWVEKLVDQESDEYFETRPRDSKIGAWASPQSQPLPDRTALDESAGETERRFAGAEVPRPPFWGGYKVVPRAIEFWHGQAGRLQDRFLYNREAEGWQLERLAP